MSSRDILIDQLGGNENSYKILIKTYCNHIRDNEDLEPFFGDYDEERLYKLQEMFLKAAFTPDEEPGGKLHRRVKAHHRQLFEKGLDDTHFESLKEHFLDALNDYCLEDDAYEACSNDLDSLRYMFEENYRRRSRGGRGYRRTSLGHGSNMEEEEEPSIAGISRRCTSLPPVKKGRSKRDPNNSSSTRNSKRGMLKATRSGDKLKTMFNATKHSGNKDDPDVGIKRHNSGDIIKTMINSATAKLHPNNTERERGLERTSSAEKLLNKLHMSRRGSKEGSDIGVKRHNSGDRLKSMFSGASLRHSGQGKERTEAGMKRTGSGVELNLTSNGTSSHSNHSRDGLDAGI